MLSANIYKNIFYEMLNALHKINYYLIEKYTKNTKITKNTNIQIYKYTNIQIYKYTNIQNTKIYNF